MSFESNQSREHSQRRPKRLVALGGALAVAGMAASGLFVALDPASSNVPLGSRDTVDAEAANTGEAESPGTRTGSAPASDQSDPRPAPDGALGTPPRTDALVRASDAGSAQRVTDSRRSTTPPVSQSVGGDATLVAQPSPTASVEASPLPGPTATPTPTATPPGGVLAPVLETPSALTDAVEDLMEGIDETLGSLTEPVEPVTELLQDAPTLGVDVDVDVHLGAEGSLSEPIDSLLNEESGELLFP